MAAPIAAAPLDHVCIIWTERQEGKTPTVKEAGVSIHHTALPEAETRGNDIPALPSPAVLESPEGAWLGEK